MGSGASRARRRVAVEPPPPRLEQPATRHTIILWDVENCPVPNGANASDVVSSLRSWVQSQGWPAQPPDGHIVAAYNVFASRSPHFWNQLKHAGVEQTAAGPKHESADRELEQRLRRELRLLPRGEDRTCVVLVSSDMDFLSCVRDELRGRVQALWVHSTAAHLAQSTLRQIEEATRPARCATPRDTRELPTWEQIVLASRRQPAVPLHAGATPQQAGVVPPQTSVRPRAVEAPPPPPPAGPAPPPLAGAINSTALGHPRSTPPPPPPPAGAGAADGRATQRRSRSRSRSRSRGAEARAPTPSSQLAPPQPQPPTSLPPLRVSPSARHAVDPAHRSVGVSAGGGVCGSFGGGDCRPLQAGSASPPANPAPTQPPTAMGSMALAGRCTGTIDHWDGRAQWGYVRSEGVRHHFRAADVLPPHPPLRVGMHVDFARAANPPGGKHGGKPVALELRVS